MIFLLWLGTALCMLAFGLVCFGAGRKAGRLAYAAELQAEQEEHQRVLFDALARNVVGRGTPQRMVSPDRRLN